MKLAPDMFPLIKQIQICTDNAKGAAARLSGKTNPVFNDQEKSLEELLVRIDNTVNFLQSFTANDFSQYTQQKITFPWYPGKMLNGHDYLVGFAIPNFYFHLTTAYALLRHCGVQIGKNDFLGELNWQNA